jgi:hypothetical protein
MPRSREKRQQTTIHEQRVQGISAAISTGIDSSAYDAAKQLSMSKATLYRRQNGGVGRVVARQSQQTLTEAEERALVKWLTHLTASGYPARHSIVRKMVVGIQQLRLAKINDASQEVVTYKPLGINWVSRFLHRYPQLQTIIARAIDTCRITEVTGPAIIEWFDVYTKIITENKILPQNLYNMDETGFPIGTIQKARVIVDSSIKMKYQAQPGRQEWVTAVECICADGSSIPPLMIFKGENLMSS